MLFRKESKAAKMRRFNRIYEQEARDQDSAVRHSRAYHRFFEGYSEEYVPKGKGNGRKICRTYVGNYYKRDCSDRTWITTKLLYFLLYLAAAVLYLFSVSRPTHSNAAWYAALPGLLSVIPMILLAAKLLACIVAKRVMVAYDYKQVFCHLFLYSTVAAGFLTLTALMMLLCVFLNSQARSSGDVISALGCLCASALIFAIGMIERSAEYVTLKNPNSPSENSVIIQEEL